MADAPESEVLWYGHSADEYRRMEERFDQKKGEPYLSVCVIEHIDNKEHMLYPTCETFKVKSMLACAAAMKEQLDTVIHICEKNIITDFKPRGELSKLLMETDNSLLRNIMMAAKGELKVVKKEARSENA